MSRPPPQTPRQKAEPNALGQVLVKVAALALILMFIRWLLVVQGVLFGSTRIVLVDIMISAVVLIVAAVLYQRRVQLAGKDAKAEGMPSALLSTAVGVLGLPALIGGLLNLVAPATPGDLAVSACATVQTYHTPYRAATTGPTGNFARSGPGLGFAQTDRLSKDCVVGFTGYCIGDPVSDPVVQGWTDTRWLLAARHDNEPARTLARWLSKEPPYKRFVSSSYLAPQSPDSDLHYLGEQQCAGGLPLPKKATLTTEDATDKSGKPQPGVIGLTAGAPHAFNIGLALTVEDPNVLDAGTAVRQIPGSGVVSDSAVHAQWDTTILRGNLRKPLTAPVTVTVLAVPCLDPLTPATPDTAATLGFRIPVDATQPVTRTTPRTLPDYVRDRLFTLACDTQLNEVQQRSANAAPVPEGTKGSRS
jgi:hypothetical protein